MHIVVSSLSMSSREGDDFLSIVSGEFTQDELDRITEEANTNPYYTEPLQPTREQLLEVFHAVLEEYATHEFPHMWEIVQANFSNLLIPQLSINVGDKVMIENSQVFVDAEGFGVIDDSVKVFGDFAGFLPGESYFVDWAGDDPDILPTGDSGLYVALDGATIEFADGEREYMGSSQISMSNGLPQVNQVFYLS